MKPLYKGLSVALLHVLIVASLGAKLLYDRATRPRVWVQAAAFDPELPIRGRYAAVTVQVETDLKPKTEYPEYQYEPVRLVAENGKLRAIPDEKGTVSVRWRKNLAGKWIAMLTEPVLFFLPQYAADPTQLERNEWLWVEVTVPKKGPPRPIQLGVNRKGRFEVLKTR